MAQASFAELEHDLKKRRTRRELFLEKMDKLVPWERLERRIEPFYAKAGRGRRPYPLSVIALAPSLRWRPTRATLTVDRSKLAVSCRTGRLSRTMR